MILDNTLDNTIKVLLTEKLNKLEEAFSADVIFYFGELHPAMVRPFRDLIEDLQQKPAAHTKNAIKSQAQLVIVLNTPGGSAEIAEKMVDIVRHHYQDVSFVVPDFAMSAGTIFCQATKSIWTIPRLLVRSIPKSGTDSNGCPRLAISTK